MASAKTESNNLIERLSGFPLKDFPRGYDYPTRFKNLNNQLNEYYHSNVTVAAALSDGSGLLTDHGPDHIRTVIERASLILGTGSGDMPTAYETYVLLAAIHVHDLGNYFGRADHELNAVKVMNELGPVLGEDEVEKLKIREIAQAHGGKIGGDKDKISRLLQKDHMYGHPLRPRFLSALLRLADELADDSSRTSAYMLKESIIPKSSVIYHKYADALRSVVVAADSVSLKFYLSEDDVRNKFEKGAGSVYLIDEIYERTMKMHRERMYCMRFLRPEINIDRIYVSIEIFTSGFTDKLDSITYGLEESGYPDEKTPNIFNLCPHLTTKTGTAVKASVNKSKIAAKITVSKNK
jgi:hypothetical protein